MSIIYESPPNCNLQYNLRKNSLETTLEENNLNFKNAWWTEATHKIW